MCLCALQLFGFHAWSSGLWVCSATGSSAAMHAAGGLPMESHAPQLQYKVREHLLDSARPELKDLDHGMIGKTKPSQTLLSTCMRAVLTHALCALFVFVFLF